jgi:23S rRNA (adenine-N6)-dimethyltransferase
VAGRRSRTARDARRRAYGQNFLANRRLAATLVRESGVRATDLVLELGAGRGVLTAELARRAGTVIAVELDPVWAEQLRKRFAARQNVVVIAGDAMQTALPTEPFRVVANVPFNRTTAVLRRLLDDPRTPLERADLVVQQAVARKRAGNPRNLLSASWSPWFRFRLGRHLPRTAFRPVPSVDAAVLVVERRREPLLPPEQCDAFAAFVAAFFDGALARELDATRWAGLFSAYASTQPGT